MELNERTDENISGTPVSLKLAIGLAAQPVGSGLLRVTSQLTLRITHGSLCPVTLRTSFNISLSEVTCRLRGGVASFLNSFFFFFF